MQDRLTADEEVEEEGSGVFTLPEVTIVGDPDGGGDDSEDAGAPEEQQVDDSEVQRIIDDAYDFAKAMKEPSKTGLAYAHVKTARDKDPQDVNMAAAEHYLYARSVAVKDGVLGAAMTTPLVMGYDLFKAGAFLAGQQDLLATTPGVPPSRPTAASTLWGLKGTADGLSKK